MEDLQRLLLLRLLVVLGPGVMLIWLYFGLNLPDALPAWSIALSLGLMALAFAATGWRRARRARATGGLGIVRASPDGRAGAGGAAVLQRRRQQPFRFAAAACR
jgi:hypothetical protein